MYINSWMLTWAWEVGRAGISPLCVLDRHRGTTEVEWSEFNLKGISGFNPFLCGKNTQCMPPHSTLYIALHAFIYGSFSHTRLWTSQGHCLAHNKPCGVSWNDMEPILCDSGSLLDLGHICRPSLLNPCYIYQGQIPKTLPWNQILKFQNIGHLCK